MVRVRHLLAPLAATATLLAFSANAGANAGALDPSFGVGGIATIALEKGHPRDLAIDHEGRIVVAGFGATPGYVYPMVTRFEPDGSADKSAGDRGQFLRTWCDSSGYVAGAAIDSADRIVLVGAATSFFSPSGICVVRLLSDGEPDRSFSGDGKTLLGAVGGANDVAIDSEGRILIAGSGRTPVGGITGFNAIRLTESGALDPSFGEGGIASIALGEESEAQAITTDSSGRVVLAGSAKISGQTEAVVARFDSSGRPDRGFAGSGYETLDLSGVPRPRTATDVTLDPLGRLVLSAKGGPEESEEALAARLLSDGSPDASFGEGGRVRLPVPDGAAADGVAVDQAGRILAAGAIRTIGPSGRRTGEEAFLARLRPDGAADGSFGSGEVVRQSPFSGGAAITVDSAGRYLTTVSTFHTFGAARYLAEAPTSPPTPESPNPHHRCHGRPATIVGTQGRDVLKGTKSRDVIAGLGGGDVIRGLGGNDVLCGGAGRDRLFGGQGNDKLYGGKGADLLVGGPGRDRLHGGPGRDEQR